MKIDPDEIGQQEPQELISASQLKLDLLLKKTSTNIGLESKEFKIDIPHKVMLGAIFNDIVKQYEHVPNWMR